MMALLTRLGGVIYVRGWQPVVLWPRAQFYLSGLVHVYLSILDARTQRKRFFWKPA